MTKDEQYDTGTDENVPKTGADSSDYEEDGEKKKSVLGTIIKTVLFIALWVFIVAICMRACQADHKELKNLYVTDELKEAYSVSQDVRTHAAGKEFSDNGALYAYSFVYIEEAEYLQVTVRYNTRHINEVIESINKNEILQYGEGAKQYTIDDIRIFYKVTDSDGNEFQVKELDTATKYNYVYRKLEVTGINFENVAINIDMMFENIERTDLEIEGKKTNTLIYKKGATTNAGTTLEAHSIDDTYIPYEFSNSEKKELGIK